jgi:hypothetical protein
MARPQVADEGDGLQIWRVATNILNKKSETAYKGWSFIFCLKMDLTTHNRKENQNMLRRTIWPWIWTDCLEEKEHRQEICRVEFKESLQQRFSDSSSNRTGISG